MLAEAIAEIRAKHPELPIEIDAHMDEETTDIKRLVTFYESMGFVVVGTENNSVYMRMDKDL